MQLNYENLKSMTKAEAEQLMKYALGRIFRMCSRPFQQGDLEDYESCKHVVYHAAEKLGITSAMPLNQKAF